MSVEIWPALPPEHLQPAVDQTRQLELAWLLSELHGTLYNLKSGLEDCYALLAPVDPGSTLVVSTPRNEVVKGHITRIGTRIVKGTLTLRLRTHPQQTYTISPSAPISVAPLTTLHALLTHSIELVTLTLPHATPPPSPSYPAKATTTTTNNRPSSPTASTATFLAAQLLLLSQSLTEALSLLKGPQPVTASDATWVSKSCAPDHFSPPTSRDLSVHWGVQDSCLVLWLRALEPADAPVSVGLKFALAIGTARRIEHDEADQVFVYTYPENTEAGKSSGDGGSNSSSSGNINDADGKGEKKNGKQHTSAAGNAARGSHNNKIKEDHRGNEVQVYVREKVRVESADPSLLSLSAKLAALNKTLELARRNLATVMGENVDD